MLEDSFLGDHLYPTHLSAFVEEELVNEGYQAGTV